MPRFLVDCQRAQEFLSRNLDGELSGREKFVMRMHVALCGCCRGFSEQIGLVKKYVHDLPDNAEFGEDHPLPEDAKARLKATMNAEETGDP